MQEEILNFLDTERTGVLAVEMLDGSPHGAALHFAYLKDPFAFIFLTTPTYRKSEPLLKNKTARATFVVGTSEATMKTLQIDGVAEIADTNDIRDAYFAKFPEKNGKHPEDIFFTLAPTRWQYTDWTKPEGKTIITSDGKVSVVGKPS